MLLALLLLLPGESSHHIHASVQWILVGFSGGSQCWKDPGPPISCGAFGREFSFFCVLFGLENMRKEVRCVFL